MTTNDIGNGNINETGRLIARDIPIHFSKLPRNCLLLFELNLLMLSPVCIT